MKNLNWPTLEKSLAHAGQVGRYWRDRETGDMLFDGFTDVGASPISNKRLQKWIREGWDNGVLTRVPHMVFDRMRDYIYPYSIGTDHLGLCCPSVFYTSGGSDAVETAIKLARRATGREWVISYKGDFHGRSLANLSLETEPDYHRAGFGPFVPKMAEAAIPLDNIGDVVFSDRVPGDERTRYGRLSLSEIAAVVISPILGNNTLEMWPEAVWKQVAAIQAAGGLVIFDEVQTGFGRAGGLVSIVETKGWRMRPDIWVFGKAAGAGWPHCPVFCDSHLSKVMGPGSHFNTMAGSPMGCYLSLRLLTWMHAEGGLDRMLANAREFVGAFDAAVAYGYMMGIHHPHPYAFVQEAREQGVLLMTARDNKPIRFSPPFDTKRREMLQVIEQLSMAGLK